MLGDRVQDAFGLLTVHVTYYDEKFEEVKTADTPGRYGALVRMKLRDGEETNRFVSLYRVSKEVTWQNIETLRLPVIAGDSPEAQRIREDAIGTPLIGSLIDGTRRTFVPGIMRGLAKVAPGLRPESIFYGFKVRDDAWWFELRKRVSQLRVFDAFRVYVFCERGLEMWQEYRPHRRAPDTYYVLPS